MRRSLVGSSLMITLVHGVAWACSCVPEARSVSDHLNEDAEDDDALLNDLRAATGGG